MGFLYLRSARSRGHLKHATIQSYMISVILSCLLKYTTFYLSTHNTFTSTTINLYPITAAPGRLLDPDLANPRCLEEKVARTKFRFLELECWCAPP